MTDELDQSPALPKRGALSRESFDCLLAALDADRERASEKYIALRDRLTDVFAWRKQEPADEFADKTLDRLARKLLESEPIANVYSYAFGIARLLMLEAARSRRNREALVRELGNAARGMPRRCARSTSTASPTRSCTGRCVSWKRSWSTRMCAGSCRGRREAG